MTMAGRVAVSGLALLVLMAAGCGGGGPSIEEYAAEVEGLLGSMNRQIQALGDVPATLGAIADYLEERVGLREEFVSGLRSLDPPKEAVEVHDAAIELVERLAVAEAAVVAQAAEERTVPGLNASEEMVALMDLDLEAQAFCRAVEEEWDTSENAPFENTAWMPGSLRDVVRITFDCGDAGVEGEG
jgi:hypothetical protein